MTDCTKRHTSPLDNGLAGEEFLIRNWWSRLVLGRYDSKRYGQKGMPKEGTA
jgi:hypothetical protein